MGGFQSLGGVPGGRVGVGFLARECFGGQKIEAFPAGGSDGVMGGRGFQHEGGFWRAKTGSFSSAWVPAGSWEGGVSNTRVGSGK